jgi:hypothetical protein
MGEVSMYDGNDIVIKATELWVKVIEMLQQNWALIEDKPDSSIVTIYFLSDTSGVFDTIDYPSREFAERALRINGFSEYLDPNENFTEFIYPPQSPYHWNEHPNGRIYSSGRYWFD